MIRLLLAYALLNHTHFRRRCHYSIRIHVRLSTDIRIRFLSGCATYASQDDSDLLHNTISQWHNVLLTAECAESMEFIVRVGVIDLGLEVPVA
jgi:hypothetical protein